MAILYGTTADGQSLPVQVNEFGQLVAQGLQGPPGPEGPEGPTGSGDPVELTEGHFKPEFVSTDEAGAGFIEYDVQDGYWYRFGPLLTVVMRCRTTSVALTNLRGNLAMGGVPDEARLAVPTMTTRYGPYSMPLCHLAGRPVVHRPTCIYKGGANHYMLAEGGGDDPENIKWADLDAEGDQVNDVRLTFSGLALGTVRSVPGLLDDVM